MAATLPVRFTVAGVVYSQIVRNGNFAIFSVRKPNRATNQYLYEVVKLVGERYPSNVPAVADNRKFQTNRLNEAYARYYFLQGIHTGHWKPDPKHIPHTGLP